jgi:polyhydroxyalkanoate synthesis repressor PhaR
MRTIKKYSNRRLYDTSASKYVNLDELAALVRNGEEVTVVDAKTGADLTRPVLVQIVMEVQGGLDLFPVGLLHRIIRYGGDSPYHRMGMKQMAAGLELLDAQVMRFERQFEWMRPRTPEPPPTAAGTDEEPPPESTDDSSGTPDAELDALRSRLADLEARLRGSPD